MDRICWVCFAVFFATNVELGQSQTFHFGEDLINGVESGRAGGGLATGYVDFAVDGAQLTAVLRNTSPDKSNFDRRRSTTSPSARWFEFNLRDFAGEWLEVMEWQLTAVDDSGAEVVLGSDSSANDWRVSQRADGAFRFRSAGGKQPTHALYNPGATGGFASNSRFFTEATLVASFNARIGSHDLNPQIRFDNIGRSEASRTLSGIAVRSTSSQPEPASLAAWSGLLAFGAIAVWRRRRSRLGVS